MILIFLPFFFSIIFKQSQSITFLFRKRRSPTITWATAKPDLKWIIHSRIWKKKLWRKVIDFFSSKIETILVGNTGNPTTTSSILLFKCVLYTNPPLFCMIDIAATNFRRLSVQLQSFNLQHFSYCLFWSTGKDWGWFELTLW